MKPDRALRNIKTWQEKGIEGVLKLLKKTKGNRKKASEPRLSKDNTISRPRTLKE